MQEGNLFYVIFVGGGSIGYVILALSVVTVALIVKYMMSIRRTTILPEQAHASIQAMFEEKKYREAIDAAAAEPDFLSYVVHSALTEAHHGYAAMERAMEEAAEERITKQLRDIEWLNLIGNVAPMLGLLGTVWGMLRTFLAMSGGTQDAAKLAGPIGLALVTTLLGLAVAIPALAFFSYLRNRIDALTSEAMVLGQDLLSNFRSDAR